MKELSRMVPTQRVPVPLHGGELVKKQVERMGLHVETEAPYDVDYSTGEILTKFPDKGFSNNPAKTVWKPDMTNISPELRKMFRERKQPEDGETK